MNNQSTNSSFPSPSLPPSSPPSFLSLEEEFAIAAFANQASNLSREQAIELLKEVYRLYVVARKLYLNELASSFLPSSALIL
jgi:hypothetical protein